MRCGLFGKLPAKRDFLAIDVPRGFLTVWERFLAQNLAGSQAYLTAPLWQEAYQGAAIWRFWLGPELCGGMPFMGALMPSVDALGRQFPLSLIAFHPDAPVKPPLVEPWEGWFGAAEEFLLSALDPYFDFNADACLERLASAPQSEDFGIPRRYRCAFAMKDQDCELPAIFASGAEIRLEEASFWWTIGGSGFAPMAFRLKGLPDCKVFAYMLTGRFPEASGVEIEPGAGGL